MYYATLLDKGGRKRFSGIQVPDYATDMHGLVLISLFGPQQAIRACWANIVKGRSRKSRVQDTEVRLKSGRDTLKVGVTYGYRYRSFPVAEGAGLLIIRTEFSMFANEFLIGGTEDDPPPHFMRAFRNVKGVPYRPEWLPVLWRDGVENDLIVPVSVTTGSARIWRVKRSTYPWSIRVKKLLQEGRIE